MANSSDTFLSGSNIDFIEGLYARWLEDPASVDPSWRELFAGTSAGGRPLIGSEGCAGQRVWSGERCSRRPIGERQRRRGHSDPRSAGGGGGRSGGARCD